MLLLLLLLLLLSMVLLSVFLLLLPLLSMVLLLFLLLFLLLDARARVFLLLLLLSAARLDLAAAEGTFRIVFLASLEVTAAPPWNVAAVDPWPGQRTRTNVADGKTRTGGETGRRS